VLVLKGLVGLHRTIQLQLLQRYWLGHSVQETGIKTISMEKKCKKSKMAVWRGLTNSCEKKRSEKQGEIRKPSSAINAKK